MGLILIYSWANGIKVKLLLCLACGYKIRVCISLWTLTSKDLLIIIIWLFLCIFFSPKINPKGFQFLLNAENDLAYFDGLWTMVLHVLHSFSILGLWVIMVMKDRTLSHWLSNISAVRDGVFQEPLSWQSLLFCIYIAAGPWSQAGAKALFMKCSANTLVLP